MSTLAARIVGHVTFRQGDGPEAEIPPGPCEITLTHSDATISWDDADTRGSTALPIAEYTRYIDSGEIVLEG